MVGVVWPVQACRLPFAGVLECLSDSQWLCPFVQPGSESQRGRQKDTASSDATCRPKADLVGLLTRPPAVAVTAEKQCIVTKVQSLHHPLRMVPSSSSNTFALLTRLEERSHIKHLMEDASSKARRLDWGKHEAEILELFVTRNKTLKEVRKQMEERHGFVAT